MSTVKIVEEVLQTCLTHALSTETDGIIGLLLGSLENYGEGKVKALIWGALPKPRCDRLQYDTEELDHEHLNAAYALAELLTASTGETTRVIGYYRSRPHSVYPRKADEMLSYAYDGMIGLVFSCQNENLVAYPHNPVLVGIKVSRFSNNLDEGARVKVVTYLDVERLEGNGTSSQKKEDDQIYFNTTESVREAIRCSEDFETSDKNPWKEIALQILPKFAIINTDLPACSIVELQTASIETNREYNMEKLVTYIRDGKIHPLSYLHETSALEASLCRYFEYCLSPSHIILERQLKENQTRLSSFWEEGSQVKLTKERLVLENKLADMKILFAGKSSPSTEVQLIAALKDFDIHGRTAAKMVSIYRENLKMFSTVQSQRLDMETREKFMKEDIIVYYLALLTKMVKDPFLITFHQDCDFNVLKDQFTKARKTIYYPLLRETILMSCFSSERTAVTSIGMVIGCYIACLEFYIPNIDEITNVYISHYLSVTMFMPLKATYEKTEIGLTAIKILADSFLLEPNEFLKDTVKSQVPGIVNIYCSVYFYPVNGSHKVLKTLALSGFLSDKEFLTKMITSWDKEDKEAKLKMRPVLKYIIRVMERDPRQDLPKLKSVRVLGTALRKNGFRCRKKLQIEGRNRW